MKLITEFEFAEFQRYLGTKNKGVENILLDLDGVLSDFITLALWKMNNDISNDIVISVAEYADIGKFDIAKSYGVSMKQFWEIIERDDCFWSNLNPFPWAKDLVLYLQNIAPVTICTSPSHHPKCATQKFEWVEKHLGLKNSSMMIGGRKYLMAKPGNLLIDDYEGNVDKFIEEGGMAIKVPSNWNTYPLTYDKVLEAINKVIKCNSH